MKNLIISSILVFSVMSCNNSSRNNDNEKLVKQFFEHFNRHDYEKMANMYIENAEFKDPTLGLGIVKQTRLQTIQKYKALNEVFPDIHDEIQNIYPAGENNIVVEFVSSGKALDNSKFELPICTIFTIENGLITKDFTYFDNFEESK
jgi:ketosteroid isomerase-like protein